MKASFQQNYPATVEKLWQVFGDPDYPHKKYHALGITGYAVHQFDVNSKQINLDMTRTLSIPSSRIPAFVQKHLHPEQTLRYVSCWHRTAPDLADFDLEIIPHGLPVHIKAVGTLKQTGTDSCTLSLDCDIKARVPLLGHKIESLIAQQIEKSLHSDHAFTLRYLAENT